MTDITDQDRRSARGWATMMDKQIAGNPDARAAARVILATVEAPAPTLAERLEYRADMLDNGDPDGDTPQALRDLATDAAQMEHELTEARAEVDQWKQVSRIETTTLREQRDEAHAEIVRGREIIRKRKEQVDRIADDRDEALAEVERLRATHPNVEGTRHGYDIRHAMRKPEPEYSTYTTPEGDVYRIYETADQLPDTDESFRDRYGALTDAEYEKENEVLGIRNWSDGPWVKVKGDEKVDGWADFVGFKYPIWGL